MITGPGRRSVSRSARLPEVPGRGADPRGSAAV